MELEQTLAVNPFGKQIEVDRKPEAIEPVEIKLDESIERTFRQYERLIDIGIIDIEIFDLNRIPQKIKNPQVESLHPHQIDFLLQKMIYEIPKKKLESLITGIFIGQLIQASHNIGYMEFNLTTLETAISKLGLGVSLKSGYRSIVINIRGNTGEGCGARSGCCIYNIEGNTGNDCGYNTNYSVFNIKGQTGLRLGEGSYNSIFNIQNFKNNNLGFNRTDNCVYKTSNANTYELLLKIINPVNIIQLLDCGGNIIQEMKK